MPVLPYSHLVTATEIAAIKLLGFKLTGMSALEHEFINKHFPNLDLFRLLRILDDIFTPLCSCDINKKVEFFDTKPPGIVIAIYTEGCSSEEANLAFCRIFTSENDELIVRHEFLKIPEIYRRRGVGKSVLTALLQQYVNMGIIKIKVHAGRADGGYVWGKHFFTADSKIEIDIILAAAEAALDSGQYKAVRRVYDNYYSRNPDGKTFPINKWAYLPFMEQVLKGSEWHGTIDLKNPEQFNNFIRYVLR